jgi:hypothetical protein
VNNNTSGLPFTFIFWRGTVDFYPTGPCCKIMLHFADQLTNPTTQAIVIQCYDTVLVRHTNLPHNMGYPLHTIGHPGSPAAHQGKDIDFIALFTLPIQLAGKSRLLVNVNLQKPIELPLLINTFLLKTLDIWGQYLQ